MHDAGNASVVLSPAAQSVTFRCIPSVKRTSILKYNTRRQFVDLILKILTAHSAGSPKKITNCITLVNFWAGYIPVAGIPAIKKNNEDIEIF